MKHLKQVVVTGSNGQLGKCFSKISSSYQDEFKFYFTTSSQLDIRDEEEVYQWFDKIKPYACINLAAYTAVDRAEEEEDEAFEVNAVAVEYLAKACRRYNSILIHISTDYVFDGETSLPYDEDGFTHPLSIYGASKREGEELALENNPRTIILRTSWLYSEFGSNFVKTILQFLKSKEEIKIVSDQYGQPTNAHDLAEVILEILKKNYLCFGIYHYANYPETTWYHYAKKIVELSGKAIPIIPISTEDFPTKAKRPKRSTLCLDKIEKTFQVDIKYWENSLEDCINALNRTDD